MFQETNLLFECSFCDSKAGITEAIPEDETVDNYWENFMAQLREYGWATIPGLNEGYGLLMCPECVDEEW